MERIYGIYDKAAEALMMGGGGIKWVMIYPNDAVARRDFTAIVRQVEPLHAHPDDYELVRFGIIDLERAAIQPEHRMTVMSARDALQTDPRQLELESATPVGRPPANAQTAARRPMGVLESDTYRAEALPTNTTNQG